MHDFPRNTRRIQNKFVNLSNRIASLEMSVINDVRNATKSPDVTVEDVTLFKGQLQTGLDIRVGELIATEIAILAECDIIIEEKTPPEEE